MLATIEGRMYVSLRLRMLIDLRRVVLSRFKNVFSSVSGGLENILVV